MNKSNKIIVGAKWSLIERLTLQSTQFLLGIIIARLVLPSEYGLIAMLSVFLAVAQVFIDSGFTYSLLQKQNRTDKDFSTVFVFNVVLAFAIYWLFFILARYIADFYNEEQLKPIIRVSFLALIINSFSIVQRVRFQIALNFKTQAYVAFVSTLISGVIAILLAYIGMGVWALVTQTLLASFMTTIGFWILGKWNMKLVFSKKSFNDLFPFGLKILITMLMDTVYVNLYNLLIGKTYSSENLGFYNRAFTLSQFPSRNLYNILNRVLFPVLCEQQNDTIQQTETYKKYIQLILFIVFPLMVYLSFFAYPIIDFILSSKWTPCAIYLSILSIAYMFFPIMASLFDLVNSRGFSNLTLKAEVFKKIFGISVVIITIPMGIIPLCIGALITNIFDIIIIMYYSRKVTPIGYTLMFKVVTPILVLSTLAGLLSYQVVHSFGFISVLETFIGFGLMMLLYLFLASVFKFKQISLIVSIIRKA